MEKQSVYTAIFWCLFGTIYASEDATPPPPPLRRLITRSISIGDLNAEQVEENYKKLTAAQRANLIPSPAEPNSPPLPLPPPFPVPALPPIVLPTIIDMQQDQGSPRPMPRTPSPSSAGAPRRRLAVIPYSSYQPATPSPRSAERSPSPRPVTPEDPHARALMQSVFLRLMDDDANVRAPEDDEAPL